MYLDIAFCCVTDAGLVHVGRLRALETLHLHAAGIFTLPKHNLERSGMTAQGLAQYRERLKRHGRVQRVEVKRDRRLATGDARSCVIM